MDKTNIGRVLLASAALVVAAGARAQVPAHPRYDYPTAARADYVVGCLAANDLKHEMLAKCACEIDVIANRIPYQQYDDDNTVIGIQQNGGLGVRSQMLSDNPAIQAQLDKLYRAEAEANLRCE